MADIETLLASTRYYAETTAPSTPSAGSAVTYVKSADKKLYLLDSTGTETDLTAAGGGGGSGTENHAICQGRLTLETGVAISTSDQSAKATLYFTPFHGNLIGTYTDSAWQLQSFTEKSLSLAGYTADKNYDIWIEDSDLSLSSTVWTNDSTRATALASQDGVYVKTGDVSKRYLGTIRINSTGGQTEDTVTQRYVWNACNRAARPMLVTDATVSWTYATSTWRYARASSANRLQFVVGLSEDVVEAFVSARFGMDSGISGSIAIGYDTNSAPSSLYADTAGYSSSQGIPVQTSHVVLPLPGYHYLAWVEYRRAGTLTVYGTLTNQFLSGIQGTVRA